MINDDVVTSAVFEFLRKTYTGHITIELLTSIPGYYERVLNCCVFSQNNLPALHLLKDTIVMKSKEANFHECLMDDQNKYKLAEHDRQIFHLFPNYVLRYINDNEINEIKK